LSPLFYPGGEKHPFLSQNFCLPSTPTRVFSSFFPFPPGHAFFPHPVYRKDSFCSSPPMFCPCSSDPIDSLPHPTGAGRIFFSGCFGNGGQIWFLFFPSFSVPPCACLSVRSPVFGSLFSAPSFGLGESPPSFFFSTRESNGAFQSAALPVPSGCSTHTLKAFYLPRAPPTIFFFRPLRLGFSLKTGAPFFSRHPRSLGRQHFFFFESGPFNRKRPPRFFIPSFFPFCPPGGAPPKKAAGEIFVTWPRLLIPELAGSPLTPPFEGAFSVVRFLRLQATRFPPLFVSLLISVNSPSSFGERPRHPLLVGIFPLLVVSLCTAGFLRPVVSRPTPPFTFFFCFP